MKRTKAEVKELVNNAFKDLPAPEKVVAWAKENNFKLQCGSIGRESCGCALTAITLMGYPEFFKDVDDSDIGTYDSYDIVYGKGRGSAERDKRNQIFGGFDAILRPSVMGTPCYAYGKAIRELAGIKDN